MNDERRAARWLYVFAVLPFLMFIAFRIAAYVPDRWRNLYGLAAAIAFLSIIAGLPVREHLRQERLSGLIPRRKGFEGKLEAAAEKLRERAAQLESEGFAGSGATLASYIRELQRVALSQKKHALLQGFVLEPADEETETHVRRLRKAAEELELYAGQLRTRGGMFRLDTIQIVYGAAILLAMFTWGAYLMWTTIWTPSLAFLGGAALIAFATLIAFGLWKSQRG